MPGVQGAVRSERDLEHHVLEEHPRLTRICDLCCGEEAAFISKSERNKHVKLKHTAACMLCGEVFFGDERLGQLRAHVSEAHGINRKKYGEYSRPCMACGAVFRRYNSQFKVHQERMGPMNDGRCSGVWSHGGELG